MAMYLENYGLDVLAEDEDTLMGFLRHLTEKGKPVIGYYGHPYLFTPMGNVEFWVNTEIGENAINVTGFDTHCGGDCIWDMVCSGMDLTPKNSSPLKRVVMFKSVDGRACMLPVHVITADVLPGFLEGDKVRLQMIALPLKIEYYENEDEFQEKTCQTDAYGKKWGISLGSLLALPFLVNHEPNTYEQGKDYETDSYLRFSATVTGLWHGTFESEENKFNTFIRCRAETMYGELEFDHTYEQVPEDLRKNIKVGAVISGVCILSGDAAIYEYENGVVKDHEHDLALLRYTFVKGDAKRLRYVLSPDAVYETDNADKPYTGRDEIIDRLNYVRENRKTEYVTRLATVTEAEGLEYPVGTRCILLYSDAEDRYESITFIDVDEAGMITRIRVSNDDRYGFMADLPVKVETPMDDIDPPECVSEPILNRAKFHDIVDFDLEVEDVTSGVDDRALFSRNAGIMLEALREKLPENAERYVSYALGYLFERAVEQTVLDLRLPAGAERTPVPILPREAFDGTVGPAFSPEEQKKLERAFDLGRQFQKDLSFFMEMNKLGESDFTRVFKEAAITVQRIGQLGAKNLLGLQ